MYEHRRRPLVPFSRFVVRVAISLAMGGVVMGVSLGIGMMGYHVLEGESWVDAFANAAMILSGMGPLNPLTTTGGKIFAGCYALFSGLAFITAMGIVFAPVFHRFLHRFHLDEEGK